MKVLSEIRKINLNVKRNFIQYASQKRAIFER